MPTDTPNNVGASVPLTAKDRSKTSKNGPATGANNIQLKAGNSVTWCALVGRNDPSQPCDMKVTAVEVQMRWESTQVWRSCKRNGCLSKSKLDFQIVFARKSEPWAERRLRTEKRRWMKHETDKNVQEKRNLWLLWTEEWSSANGAWPFGCC